MRSEGGVAVECLCTLLGAREPDSAERAAQMFLGAELLLEGVFAIKAIAKGLAQLGK